MTQQDIDNIQVLLQNIKENCMNILLLQNDVIETKSNNIKQAIEKQDTNLDDVSKAKDTTKENDTNILIISEKTGKVYLPYSKSDIDYYMKCGYESEKEIAKRFYTVPLKQYSNFAKSRVRERI